MSNQLTIYVSVFLDSQFYSIDLYMSSLTTYTDVDLTVGTLNVDGAFVGR